MAKSKSNTVTIAPQGKGAPYVNREDCTVLVNVTEDDTVRKYELNRRFSHPAECFEARSIIIEAGQIDLQHWTLVEERPVYRESGVSRESLQF